MVIESTSDDDRVGEIRELLEESGIPCFLSNELFPTDAPPLEIESTPGVVLRGVIDAIFDDPDVGTRIVDWKTGPNLAQAAAQLEFYCLAWWLDRGELESVHEALVEYGAAAGTLEHKPAEWSTLHWIAYRLGQDWMARIRGTTGRRDFSMLFTRATVSGSSSSLTGLLK